MDAFYVPEGGGLRATDLTRGPWHRDFQHGGPPAAVMVRALEPLLAEGMQLARVTIELQRPIKIGRIDVAARVVRAGRKVQHLAATLSADGVESAQAQAVAIRSAEVPVPPPVAPTERPAPPSTEQELLNFYFFRCDRGYHRGMEGRIARGKLGAGATQLWLRMAVPLVAGETPSGWQRVLCAADSGNGVSFAVDPARISFVNPDLTVALHRPPVGEWVCLDAVTTLSPTGMGLADTRLWDEDGAIGRGLQTLVVETVP